MLHFHSLCSASKQVGTVICQVHQSCGSTPRSFATEVAVCFLELAQAKTTSRIHSRGLTSCNMHSSLWPNQRRTEPMNIRHVRSLACPSKTWRLWEWQAICPLPPGTPKRERESLWSEWLRILRGGSGLGDPPLRHVGHVDAQRLAGSEGHLGIGFGLQTSLGVGILFALSYCAHSDRK